MSLSEADLHVFYGSVDFVTPFNNTGEHEQGTDVDLVDPSLCQEKGFYKIFPETRPDISPPIPVRH